MAFQILHHDKYNLKKETHIVLEKWTKDLTKKQNIFLHVGAVLFQKEDYRSISFM